MAGEVRGQSVWFLRGVGLALGPRIVVSLAWEIYCLVLMVGQISLFLHQVVSR
jgi:hypothetical protein